MSIMRPLLIAAAALASTCARADPGVRMTDLAARVVVVPEARTDVAVTVERGDRRLPAPTARLDGDTIVVDGGLAHRIQSCGVLNWNWWAAIHRQIGTPHPGQRVMVRGVGFLALDHLPVVTVRLPLHAAVAADGAVWGEIGPTDAIALTNAGCGAWRLGPVRGRLSVANSGSGGIGGERAGDLVAKLLGSGDLALGDIVHTAKVTSAGSGDVRLGKVGGALKIAMHGSGALTARDVEGPVDVAISGSGDVTLQGGRAPVVAVQLAGSGDFTFHGEAGSLAAQTAGSGDVRVARVIGAVSRASAGSGKIVVGGH